MAGSISLSLSQQFDRLGRPLTGGKLYFFQAGTVSTPQNAYKDVGLTLAHANPIVLDAAGRVPAFYLADGAIKIRLTDKSGVVQVEQDQLLVIGPSAGGGGGGPGIDPTTVFKTGYPLWIPVQGLLDGFVRMNGRTIGAATSGATERANADTQPLYVYAWTNYPDSMCPVTGGRGASAAADFAANKTLTLLDMRGRAPFGLDGMGSALAGRITAATIPANDTPAAGGGADRHTITQAELPNYALPVSVTDPGHFHVGVDLIANNQIQGGGNNACVSGPQATHNQGLSTDSRTTGISVSVNSGGGATAFDKLPPVLLGTWYWKL